MIDQRTPCDLNHWLADAKAVRTQADSLTCGYDAALQRRMCGCPGHCRNFVTSRRSVTACCLALPCLDVRRRDPDEAHWRIDIHSESKIYELERRAKEQIAHAVAAEGFDGGIAETLFKLGWRSVGELARAHVEELAGLPGIGGPDGARKVIEGAKGYMQSGGR